MNMEHDRYQKMLGDMMDGVLQGADRSRVLTHLAGCTECRAELDAISTLRGEARALPRGIAPPRDLWSGIAARIGERESAPAVLELASRRPAMPSWRRWAPLAAAAVLLIVASSGLTLALMRGTTGSSPIAQPAPGAAAVEESRPITALAAFRPAEIEYQNAVAALESELAERRGSLAPETIEVIETNLAIIDQAIAEARAALEADPSSADLSRHLSGVYRQKVELLGSAVKIAT